MVILGDWAQLFLEESNLNQTCGVRNKIQRATIGQILRLWRSKITNIQHIQYRAPTKQEKGVYLKKK